MSLGKKTSAEKTKEKKYPRPQAHFPQLNFSHTTGSDPSTYLSYAILGL
jgi:hypothetical protein